MGLSLERQSAGDGEDDAIARTESRPIPKTPTHAILSVSPSDAELDGDRVPTVIRWTGTGDSVYVTGTFNDWKTKIPLSRSAGEWTTIEYLPPGMHQYKFIVDGQWRHAEDQPIAADFAGHLNNCVEVQRASATSIMDHPLVFANGSPDDDAGYGQAEELPSGPFKPPPKLPPHLLRSLVNTSMVSEDDPSLLPLPHHVMIDHCYSATRDPAPPAAAAAEPASHSVRVLGSTHRYKTKFITTVFYTPAAHQPAAS